MPFRTRRSVYYLGLVVLTTVAFTVAYNTGMSVWENSSQSLYHSLEIVVQSFTTTGYGEDAPWDTPQMHLLVIAMQFAGIGLILTAVDIFAIPWLQDALTPTAPDAISDVDDHVIICPHTPRTEAFITELTARDHEYVLVEPDGETAHDLYEDEYRVMYGNPESTDTLHRAQIEDARAVVADAEDDTNASIALSANEAADEVRVITLVDDAELARYHRAAGADDALSPRQLLGESLAEEVPTAVTADIEDGILLAEDVELVELTVADDSELCRQTLGEAALREQGVEVIGAWFTGEFETPVEPDRELEAGTRLLVSGKSADVDALREATAASVRGVSTQEILLAGYGDSGQAVYEALSQTTAQLAVLDIEDKSGADAVGDARDPSVLESTGIEHATALVLTVADDTTAIFTTLIARELNSELQIVVRANEETNVRKLYRAGADYVQSLATVSGRMLVSKIFAAEEVLAYDKQISVVRRPAAGLAQQTLVDARVRTETGCTVVAIDRDDETVTEFDPATFTLRSDDEVIIAGTDEAIARFEQQFSQ